MTLREKKTALKYSQLAKFNHSYFVALKVGNSIDKLTQESETLSQNLSVCQYQQTDKIS